MSGYYTYLFLFCATYLTILLRKQEAKLGLKLQTWANGPIINCVFSQRSWLRSHNRFTSGWIQDGGSIQYITLRQEQGGVREAPLARVLPLQANYEFSFFIK